MATVEEHAIEIHNGAANGTTIAAPAGAEIPVENPATGEIIATVPDLDAAAVAELAKRGRAAQPAWEAYGFEGRARVLRRDAEVGDGQLRARHRRRSSRRPARPTRTRSWPRSPTPATRSASGPRTPRSTSPTSACTSSPMLREGQEADPALPPARPGRRDRPVELPADQLLRRLHPRAGGRQQRDPQALGGHAADLAAAGRGPARVRPARGRLAGRHRPRRDRRGAGRSRST